MSEPYPLRVPFIESEPSEPRVTEPDERAVIKESIAKNERAAFVESIAKNERAAQLESIALKE